MDHEQTGLLEARLERRGFAVQLGGEWRRRGMAVVFEDREACAVKLIRFEGYEIAWEATFSGAPASVVMAVIAQVFP